MQLSIKNILYEIDFNYCNWWSLFGLGLINQPQGDFHHKFKIGLELAIGLKH